MNIKQISFILCVVSLLSLSLLISDNFVSADVNASEMFSATPTTTFTNMSSYWRNYDLHSYKYITFSCIEDINASYEYTFFTNVTPQTNYVYGMYIQFNSTEAVGICNLSQHNNFSYGYSVKSTNMNLFNGLTLQEIYNLVYDGNVSYGSGYPKYTYYARYGGTSGGYYTNFYATDISLLKDDAKVGSAEVPTGLDFQVDYFGKNVLNLQDGYVTRTGTWDYRDNILLWQNYDKSSINYIEIPCSEDLSSDYNYTFFNSITFQTKYHISMYIKFNSTEAVGLSNYIQTRNSYCNYGYVAYSTSMTNFNGLTLQEIYNLAYEGDVSYETGYPKIGIYLSYGGTPSGNYTSFNVEKLSLLKDTEKIGSVEVPTDLDFQKEFFDKNVLNLSDSGVRKSNFTYRPYSPLWTNFNLTGASYIEFSCLENLSTDYEYTFFCDINKPQYYINTLYIRFNSTEAIGLTTHMYHRATECDLGYVAQASSLNSFNGLTLQEIYNLAYEGNVSYETGYPKIGYESVKSNATYYTELYQSKISLLKDNAKIGSVEVPTDLDFQVEYFDKNVLDVNNNNVTKAGFTFNSSYDLWQTVGNSIPADYVARLIFPVTETFSSDYEYTLFYNVAEQEYYFHGMAVIFNSSEAVGLSTNSCFNPISYGYMAVSSNTSLFNGLTLQEIYNLAYEGDVSYETGYPKILVFGNPNDSYLVNVYLSSIYLLKDTEKIGVVEVPTGLDFQKDYFDFEVLDKVKNHVETTNMKYSPGYLFWHNHSLSNSYLTYSLLEPVDPDFEYTLFTGTALDNGYVRALYIKYSSTEAVGIASSTWSMPYGYYGVVNDMKLLNGLTLQEIYNLAYSGEVSYGSGYPKVCIYLSKGGSSTYNGIYQDSFKLLKSTEKIGEVEITETLLDAFYGKPISDDGSVIVNRNKSLTFFVNASVQDGETLTYYLLDLPEKGDVELIDSSTGSVRYTATYGEKGFDLFTFYVIDNNSYQSETSTVSIKLLNTPPSGSQNDIYVPSGSVTEDIIINDADGDALSFEVVNQPLYGNASIIEGGKLTYTPNVGYTGYDYAYLIAYDGESYSDIFACVFIVGIESGSGSGSGSEDYDYLAYQETVELTPNVLLYDELSPYDTSNEHYGKIGDLVINVFDNNTNDSLFGEMKVMCNSDYYTVDLIVHDFKSIGNDLKLSKEVCSLKNPVSFEIKDLLSGRYNIGLDIYNVKGGVILEKHFESIAYVKPKDMGLSNETYDLSGDYSMLKKPELDGQKSGINLPTGNNQQSSSFDNRPTIDDNKTLPKIDMPKIDMPKIDMPKIDMPKIDMPKITIPKFDLPEISIDYYSAQQIILNVYSEIKSFVKELF